jgi:hypothetical protein
LKYPDETLETQILKHLKHKISPATIAYLVWNYGSQQVQVMGTSRAMAGDLLLVARCTQ